MTTCAGPGSGLVGKLDGLSEYDVRRPLTRTGTNLLGLVKHLTLCEARYFGGDVRAPAAPTDPGLRRPGFDNRRHLWATSANRARRSWPSTGGLGPLRRDHRRPPIDATGYVPWWPRAARQAVQRHGPCGHRDQPAPGHADILREQLDGALGSDPTPLSPQDEADWVTHRAKIEKAAEAARS